MYFLIALVGLAVQLSAAPRTFDIGDGYRAEVRQKGNAANYSERYYCSTLTIRHGADTVEKLDARTLVDTWLSSDTVFGHDSTNQLRYLDAPRPGVSGGVQATIYEVVPAAGGCLIRFGVINVSQSSPVVDRNVIVWWKRSAPDQWPVIGSFMDGFEAYWLTVSLTRYQGVNYLLDGRTLYRLGSDPSQRTPLATIPPVGKFDQGIPPPLVDGLKRVGSNLILLQPVSHVPGGLFEAVNLKTGKVRRMSKSRLQNMGVEVPLVP